MSILTIATSISEYPTVPQIYVIISGSWIPCIKYSGFRIIINPDIVMIIEKINKLFIWFFTNKYFISFFMDGVIILDMIGGKSHTKLSM